MTEYEKLKRTISELNHLYGVVDQQYKKALDVAFDCIDYKMSILNPTNYELFDKTETDK